MEGGIPSISLRSYLARIGMHVPQSLQGQYLYNAHVTNLEAFNDLCTKADDIEINLYKSKKNTKESSGKTGRLVATEIASREGA